MVNHVDVVFYPAGESVDGCSNPNLQIICLLLTENMLRSATQQHMFHSISIYCYDITGYCLSLGYYD